MAEATITTQRMTPDLFEVFAASSDSLYELIAGEVVEVVTGEKSSAVTAMITTYLGMYLLQHRIGYITGSQGGYRVGESRLIPDVGLVLHTRRQEPQSGPWPDGLDLAVEVISPTDRPKTIVAKVHEYTITGCVVWLIDPEARTVQVFIPGQSVQNLADDDTLTGGELLPGFSVPIKAIFSPPQPEASHE